MPTNINAHILHHPFVNPDEIPFPTMILPGGGRLAIYPAVKTRYPGPGVGVGVGLTGMPHPLGQMSWGAGMGIDATAASWRRYEGLGGMMTGYPLGYRMPGPSGFGGYWGGWGIRD